jgi:hypothetical protein
MSAIIPKPFIEAALVEGIGVLVERGRILAEAKNIRERAAAFGMLEEVAGILCPPVKRNRGRQKGSKSRHYAGKNDKLMRAYQEEAAKSPTATEKEIADRLFANGGLAYGNSAAAIKNRIAKSKDRRSVLERAGQKPGRPKNRR